MLLERQTDETIRAEVQALADQYRLPRAPRHHRHDPAPQQGRQRLASISSPIRRAGASPAISTTMPAEASSEDPWIEFPLDVEQRLGARAPRRRAPSTPILTGDFELVVGRDVEALRQFARHHPRVTHLLRAGHRAGAGPRRRPADEPQLPAPRRCHHRRQPHHHGGQHVGPHAGAADRATSSTGWPWR